MIWMKDSTTFCFNFDLSKDVDEDLKHEIEFIIKPNKNKRQDRSIIVKI